jgi:hypothetical protein
MASFTFLARDGAEESVTLRGVSAHLAAAIKAPAVSRKSSKISNNPQNCPNLYLFIRLLSPVVDSKSD